MNENNDPIILYLIVRESLNMSAGKISAQTAHAVQNILLHYFKVQLLKAKFHKELPETEIRHIHITTSWLDCLSRKVVLKASDKEWEKIKLEFTDLVLIKDAGLTKVPANSETVIALWPQHKSTVPKIIKRLQAL